MSGITSQLDVTDQSVAKVGPVAYAIDDEWVARRDPVFQHLFGDARDPRLLRDNAGEIAPLVLEKGLVDAKDLSLFDEETALRHIADLP